MFEFDHADGGQGDRCAMVGGYVVRDGSLGSLTGSYVYGDFCSGKLYSAPVAGGAPVELAPSVSKKYVNSFGEDSCGHIFVISDAPGAGEVSQVRSSTTTACPDPPPPSQPRASDPTVRIDPRQVHVARTGYLRLRLRCSATAATSCAGSVALRRSGLVLARATFTGAPGHLLSPRMRLSSRGRALLAARRRLAVQAAARSRDASEHSVRTSARITLGAWP
jgi:hypothetical protein